MRYAEIKAGLLTESSLRARLWIDPDGVIYEIGETMHDRYIMSHPDLFGIELEDFRNNFNDRIDNEAIIADALDNGWVRVSSDLRAYKHDSISMSACDLTEIRRGIVTLHKRAFFPARIEVELQSLHSDMRTILYGKTYELEGRNIDLFVKTGAVPRGVSAI